MNRPGNGPGLGLNAKRGKDSAPVKPDARFPESYSRNLPLLVEHVDESRRAG